MSELKVFTRTARLPCGNRAHFTFGPGLSGLSVVWNPDNRRNIRSERQRRRFFKAYRKERDAFLQQIAVARGEPILMIDLESDGSLTATEIHPN